MSPLLSQDCNRQEPYPCCYNQYLDKSLNKCQECPHGTFGWNCRSNCSSGFYGRLCWKRCECVISDCHHVTGCIGGSSPSTQISNTVQRFSRQSSPATILFTGAYQGFQLRKRSKAKAESVPRVRSPRSSWILII